MRSKLPEVKCESVLDLQHEFSSIQLDISLVETEESWDRILSAVLRIKSLANNGAAQFPSQLISSLRSISRPLINSLNSERSRLSGVSLELFSTLAVALESLFGPLLPCFFPTLLTICTRTNKVFCARAKSCILDIIEHTRLPAIFTYLVDSLRDKSVTLRLTAAEAALACLNTFDPPDLTKESRAREIETVIRCTIKDANADIRQVSRKIFEAYNILVPDRVDAFVDPLSPIAKKYLNIKPKVIASSSSNSIRNAADKVLLQSSSSSQLQRSLRDAKLLPSNPTHVLLPPSRPGSKTELHSTQSQPPNSTQNTVGNYLSSGSQKADPMTRTATRQPIASAPRVGPVRLAPTQPTTGPMRLSKRSEALPSGGDGPVRLLATASGPRQALDGPRRVTIVPMPPPTLPSKVVEAKKLVKPSTSTKPAASASSRAIQLPANRSTGNKPVVPAKPGVVLKVAPKSTANGWNSNPVVERPITKANSTSRTATKAAQAPSSSHALQPKKGPTSKSGKNASKEKAKGVVTPAAKEAVVAALVPLPPSPTISASKDAGDALGTTEVPIIRLDEPGMMLAIGPSPIAKPSGVEQTPISALLTSIERGFKFPDFPPLSALAIVNEGEDESFDITEACAPVIRADVKALNLRSKSNSHDEKDFNRLVLVEMQVNR